MQATKPHRVLRSVGRKNAPDRTNGNISEYLAENGEIVAHYEYSPFGETINASGVLKDSFSFRFSTKYEDAESGYYYYGFRYYQPENGRWLSRDPIEEAGGINLYEIVGNDPVDHVDYLGLYLTYTPEGSTNEFYIVEKCEVLIVFGHRTRETGQVYLVTPNVCSAGSANVCNPEEANSRNTRPLPSTQDHDNTTIFVNQNVTVLPPGGSEAAAAATDRHQGIERDGHIVLTRLRLEALRAALGLLLKCKCNEVWVREVRRGLGPDDLSVSYVRSRASVEFLLWAIRVSEDALRAEEALRR